MCTKLCSAHVRKFRQLIYPVSWAKKRWEKQNLGWYWRLVLLPHDSQLWPPFLHIMGAVAETQFLWVWLPNWCSPSLGVRVTPRSKIKQQPWKPFQGRHKVHIPVTVWLRRSLWGLALFFLMVEMNVKTCITGFLLSIWKVRGSSTKGYPGNKPLMGLLWAGSQRGEAQRCITPRLWTAWARGGTDCP